MGVAPLILVVDDDTDFRDALCGALEEEGFLTDSVSDGTEAVVRIFQEPRPDAVLLDMMMPKMDGLAFISALRQTEMRGLPVVLMTAAGVRTAQIAAVVRKLGELPDEIVAKPTSGGEFASALRRVLKLPA